jgi:deoxyadenosine/deoxycytidine kinase
MTGKLITIEGIIGAGKSSLTDRLATKYSLVPFNEPVDNDYLEAFYEDPKGRAFGMQMRMLMRRHAQQREASWRCANGARGVLLDRSLPGDRVFAKLHARAGNIHPLDFATYEAAFDVMTLDMLPPRLVIMLDCAPEEARRRIAARGRPMEVDIDVGYLAALREGYHDLMREIASGRHHWGRGTEVFMLDWSGDTPWLDAHKMAAIDRVVEEALNV